MNCAAPVGSGVGVPCLEDSGAGLSFRDDGNAEYVTGFSADDGPSDSTDDFGGGGDGILCSGLETAWWAISGKAMVCSCSVFSSFGGGNGGADSGSMFEVPELYLSQHDTVPLDRRAA